MFWCCVCVCVFNYNSTSVYQFVALHTHTHVCTRPSNSVHMLASNQSRLPPASNIGRWSYNQTFNLPEEDVYGISLILITLFPEGSDLHSKHSLSPSVCPSLPPFWVARPWACWISNRGGEKGGRRRRRRWRDLVTTCLLPNISSSTKVIKVGESHCASSQLDRTHGTSIILWHWHRHTHTHTLVAYQYFSLRLGFVVCF